jgi:hypothetical protein
MELLRSEDRDRPPLEGIERIPRWTMLLVPVLAAAVALPGLGNHLLSDDFALLHTNVGQSASELLSPFLQQSTSRAAGGSYRPLTEAVIGLEYQLWGNSPVAFHLTNLMLHALCSLLCLWLVKVLVPPRPAVAMIAGLLFAVHPVHGDAIFWLSARSDLLCTFFYLLSMILYVRGRGKNHRRSPTVGSVLCFILALLSKEVALSLPFLVVILDLAAPSPEGFVRRFRRHLPRYLIYFLVALAYLGLRHTVLPTIGYARFPGVGTALFNMFIYFKLLVLPMNTGVGPRALVMVTLAILVVVVMFLRYARMGDRRNLVLAIAWMVTIIFPMLDVPRRWQLYLPSAGFCIFFAIVLGGLIWRRDEYHPMWVRRFGTLSLLSLLIGGGGLLYWHGSIYGDAGHTAQQILTGIQRETPRPTAGQVITAANLPGAMTHWSVDQPIFAHGFSEALKLTYGREDIEGRLLSTLYVAHGEEAKPTAVRKGGGQGLLFSTGGGASSFSLHAHRFTTGRDQPKEGDTQDMGDWIADFESVEEGKITTLRVLPKKPLGPIHVWDGEKIEILK